MWAFFVLLVWDLEILGVVMDQPIGNPCLHDMLNLGSTEVGAGRINSIGFGGHDMKIIFLKHLLSCDIATEGTNTLQSCFHYKELHPMNEFINHET